MEYTFEEHIHRFAVWTAARSVQRSWTTTSNISQIINTVQLRNFVTNYSTICEQSEFDNLHRKWCDNMIESFFQLGVTASYGRVAKIVAVYFKTSIVIRAGKADNKIHYIHPPIDRIILKNLPSNVPEFQVIRRLNWTQFDEATYWSTVNTIRDKLGLFDWRLEKLWRPELEPM